MKTNRNPVTCLAVALLAVGMLAAAATASAQPGMGPPQDAASLKSDLGCDSCHASISVPGAPPLAPAWGDIAQRWRRVPGAEQKLADIIVGGSSKRHWEGRAMFDTMLPHAPWVTPDDGRTLARWVLQQPKEKP